MPLLSAILLAAPAAGLAQTPPVTEIPGPLPVGVALGEEPPENQAGFDYNLFLPYQGQTVVSIKLEGNKITKDYVVYREIHTKVGKPLDLLMLAADTQRLQNIQVFSSVHVSAASADSGVALLFDLKEMPALLLYPALSFTDQNGWSYGVGGSSINLTGRNISASLKALFGGATTFAGSVSDPWIAGNHLSLRANVAHLEMYDQFDDFNETDNYVVPWVGTYLGNFGRAGATVNWLQVRSDVPGKTLNPDDVDNLYTTGLYLMYDSRTSVRAPNNGWYMKLEEMHTGGFLGGEGRFWDTLMDVRKYMRGFGKTQILTVGAFSQFQSGEVGVDVPDYLQFRMGGANTIRGYDLSTLGQTLYGKNQFITTVEYSFQIRPIREYTILKWSFSLGLSAAVFADNGIAWSQGSDFNADRNKVGGGVGLRLLVPGMQMFRFDFAQGEGQFLFMFGTGSKYDAQVNRIR